MVFNEGEQGVQKLSFMSWYRVTCFSQGELETRPCGIQRQREESCEADFVYELVLSEVMESLEHGHVEFNEGKEYRSCRCELVMSEVTLFSQGGP